MGLGPSLQWRRRGPECWPQPAVVERVGQPLGEWVLCTLTGHPH